MVWGPELRSSRCMAVTLLSPVPGDFSFMMSHPDSPLAWALGVELQFFFQKLKLYLKANDFQTTIPWQFF